MNDTRVEHRSRDEISPARAAELLANLGFLVVDPFPERVGDCHLLVALRDRPTLQHFDPELVRYWRTAADGRGHPSEIARDTPAPYTGSFSWGKVETYDRLGIVNEFVSIGGELAIAETARDTTIAVFHSPGPILRLGGHSQKIDAVAPDLGAFFGRMMIPIDFEPGMEQAISAASPLERYAAFIAFESERYRAYPALRDEHPRRATLMYEERVRLERETPEVLSAGRRLLAQIGLATGAG